CVVIPIALVLRQQAYGNVAPAIGTVAQVNRVGHGLFQLGGHLAVGQALERGKVQYPDDVSRERRFEIIQRQLAVIQQRAEETVVGGGDVCHNPSVIFRYGANIRNDKLFSKRNEQKIGKRITEKSRLPVWGVVACLVTGRY